MNIFLINGTPIQLMYAEEIKYRIGIKDNDAILAIRKVEGDTYRLRIKNETEVAQYGQWKEVHFIPQIKFRNFFEYIKNSFRYINEGDKLINRFEKVDNIFLGNYGNEPMRHIANKYAAKGINITFLDEGIGTIQLYDQRNAILARRIGSSSIKHFLKKYVFGLNVEHVKSKISFFTNYRLESTPYTQIVANNNDLLKRRVSEFRRREDVILIGNPFPEKGYCSVDTYIGWLSCVKSQFAEDKITYVMHPRETGANCKRYAEELGFDVVAYDLPLELQLLEERSLPAKVISFASTALTNCYDFYGSLCDHYCFIIPMNEIAVKKAAMVSMYNHMKNLYNSNNFSFIPITALKDIKYENS